MDYRLEEEADWDIDSGGNVDGDSWLVLLKDVASHCGRPIDFITDEHGNNPLHHFIIKFNKENRYKTAKEMVSDKMTKLRLKRLEHLMEICKKLRLQYA